MFLFCSSLDACSWTWPPLDVIPCAEQRAPERRTFERRPRPSRRGIRPIPETGDEARSTGCSSPCGSVRRAGSCRARDGSRIRPQAGRSGSWTEGWNGCTPPCTWPTVFPEGLRQSSSGRHGARSRRHDPLPAFDVAFGRLDAWPDGAGGAHLVLLCDVGRLELEGTGAGTWRKRQRRDHTRS